MKTKFTLLLLPLILGACSIGNSRPEDLPTQCAYQWAYEGLPELSAFFDTAVKDQIPNSSSRAMAFGENCLDKEGQVVHFLAMETDFYVTVSVESMDDLETFGDWIGQVLQVVNDLPTDLIKGPQPGFVEFRFEENMEESISFRVPIQGFEETAADKTGEELFRLFYADP